MTAAAQEVLLDGRWVFPGNGVAITNPWSAETIAEVPECSPTTVNAAVQAALRSSQTPWPAAERAALLDRVIARATDPHIQEDLARTICREAAKPIKTARGEVARCLETLRFSAVECRKLAGEVVPVEATPVGVGKLGFTLRVPVGVVAAICPFNFPLNLVAHKLGPAIAAGCSIVVKPAPKTPLSALALVRLFDEEGAPPGRVNVVTGDVAVGQALVAHDGVALVSFTGSVPVGWSIARAAYRKRVILELGSNAPLIVDAGSDIGVAAAKAAVGGFSYAGQTCISTQRIYVHTSEIEAFCELLVQHVEALVMGNPEDETTDVSQLIDIDARDRVKAWIDAAQAMGARVVTGGQIRKDGLLEPTVLADVTSDMDVQCKEAFGPVVTVTPFDDFAVALELANEGGLGLQAGVFTPRLDHAMQAIHALDFGGVLINEVPTWRADQQPYGGVGDSGNTREGPVYAVREMTEERFVTLPTG